MMKKFLLQFLIIVTLLGCGKEPQTFEEYKSAGEKAFLDGNYSKARNYLKGALEINSTDRNILYLLGVSYERDYIYDSALVYLKRADILFKNDREINKELYKISKELQDWNNAIKAINVMVASGDDINNYLPELVNYNIKIEHFGVAYHYAEKLLKSQPDNPDWYIQFANLAAEIDSLEVALATIDDAIERFGEKDEFLLNRGIYLTAQGKHLKAEKIFRNLLDKDTLHFAPYRMNLAHVLASQDDIKKKKEAYKIYKTLQEEGTDAKFRIDSMITDLEKQLNIK